MHIYFWSRNTKNVEQIFVLPNQAEKGLPGRRPRVPWAPPHNEGAQPIIVRKNESEKLKYKKSEKAKVKKYSAGVPWAPAHNEGAQPDIFRCTSISKTSCVPD